MIEIQGLDALITRLRNLERVASDLSPAYRGAIANLRQHVLRNFDTRGAISGRRWRSLRQSTLRARRHGWGYYRRGGGGASKVPNVWTGALLQDFVGYGPRHVERVGRFEFEWGAHYPVGWRSGRKWYRRVPLRFRGRAQRNEVVLAPIIGYIRQELGGEG